MGQRPARFRSSRVLTEISFIRETWQQQLRERIAEPNTGLDSRVRRASRCSAHPLRTERACGRSKSRRSTWRCGFRECHADGRGDAREPSVIDATRCDGPVWRAVSLSGPSAHHCRSFSADHARQIPSGAGRGKTRPSLGAWRACCSPLDHAPWRPLAHDQWCSVSYQQHDVCRS